jgi:hypothetical protein
MLRKPANLFFDLIPMPHSTLVLVPEKKWSTKSIRELLPPFPTRDILFTNIRFLEITITVSR